MRYRPLLYILLLVMLLVGLAPFGLFALNQTYVIAAFGAQPEDVSFAVQITYVGIIALLPIQFRLLRYFEARSYLITIMVLAIGMSFLSMQVRDIHVFMVLRLLTGFLTAAFGGRMLTLIFGLLKPGSGQIIGSTMFYGSALGGITIAGLATAAVADQMEWQHIYLFLMLAQILCLVLMLLIFRSHSGAKPYPLYQVDWVSFLLATGILTLTVYVFLYGPRYYWLSDPRIVAAASGALVSVILFVFRQSHSKRPYLHLHIFKSGQFLLGILLLTLFYGMKDTIILIYGLTGGVLKWNSNDVMQLAAVNLTGLVTAMACTAWLMLRLDKKRPLVMVAGFGVMLGYHWWMYQLFSTDLSFSDLALPVFMQGVACGMLFVPLVGFSLAALPSYTGFAGITVAAMARLAAGLNSSAGLYTLQLFYNQSNKENFLAFLSDTNFLFTERSAAYTRLFASQGFAPEQAASLGKSILFRNTLVQSQLLTNMAIFKIVAIISGIIITCLLMMVIVKSLKAGRSHET
ncbi:MFS transporter, DHA2 family, multidrug resistance protein [Dyadobacter soli]|uniref:MFS transporter, DHA2 family, multidrug resistance protein n=2 Tax=Dyadobacter soli TaxID=659014 RepID=A0A1G6VJU4_9BACT|nr:MFS transporter, DHA2 family, multidrug resistance protein [Dyadobacter soli]